MTFGAIVFLTLTWGGVIYLNVYCFYKLFKENQQDRHAPE